MVTPIQLFTDNKKLVYEVWHKNIESIESAHKLQEDVLQVGFLALWKACQNYDESRGVKFVTYAYKSILQNMRNFVVRQFRKTAPLVSIETPIRNTVHEYLEEDAATIGDTLSSPVDYALSLELKDLVDSISREVGRNCDQIISMMKQGYSQIEIARKMHTSKAKINRIIAKFKKLYKEKYNEK